MSKPFKRGSYPLYVKRFVTGAFQENAWFIRDEESGRTAIVDPGDSVDELLEESGLLAGKPLDEVLITHSHIDHIWGLSGVKERWPSVTIRGCRLDLPLLRSFPMQSQWVGLDVMLEPPPEPDVFVGEGDTFMFGKRTVKVMHTPGHCEGHIVFLFDTGDCFLGDMIIGGSVGRTDLPGGDPATMVKSLKRLTSLDPETWIYGGHGPQSRLGDEMKTNAVLPHLEQMARMPGRYF